MHHFCGRGGPIELEKEVSGEPEVPLGTLELGLVGQHQATRAVEESEPSQIVQAGQYGLCQRVQTDRRVEIAGSGDETGLLHLSMGPHGIVAVLNHRLERLDSVIEPPRHRHRGCQRDDGLGLCHVITLVSIRITGQLELADRTLDLTQRTKGDPQGTMSFSQSTIRRLS